MNMTADSYMMMTENNFSIWRRDYTLVLNALGTDQGCVQHL